MAKYLVLVALVAVLSKATWAIDSDCDYNQNLEPGQTYYIYNPGYPAAYSGERSCGWYAQSATNNKIRLSCELSIPVSENCTGDRLSVSPSGDANLSDRRNYCGNETFDLTSDGNDMFVAFTSLNGTKGGRFLCNLEVVAADTTLTCECGRKKQMRIAGGTGTGVNEYPSMAAILNLAQSSVVCGGSIISPKYVLSAAYCFRSISFNNLAVVVGEHDVTTAAETRATRVHQIDSVLVHPDYRPSELGSDIAVVRVVDTIVYSMEVGPACLPFQHANAPFNGTEVTALGWGAHEFAETGSDTLQKVQLNVVGNTRCRRTYPPVSMRELCTYTPGKYACQMDIGGPILWQDPESTRLVLVGVISSGAAACAERSPTVHTRVGAYIDWIVSVTPGVDYCRVE